jgi:hypothetical protein
MKGRGQRAEGIGAEANFNFLIFVNGFIGAFKSIRKIKYEKNCCIAHASRHPFNIELWLSISFWIRDVF